MRSVTALPLRAPSAPSPPSPEGNTVPVEPVPPRPSVAPVPIRQVMQSSGPTQESATEVALQCTEEGEFWMALVQQLVDAQSIQSLTRELALQSQLVARDEGAWLLRIERESLRAGQTREKLQEALAGLGHPVALTLEMGRVTDSPAKRLAHAARVRLLSAQQTIEQDPYVQQLMHRYDAKIVQGSIQPL